MTLDADKCIPCKVGAPKLDRTTIQQYLQMINSDWRYEESPDRIVRECVFDDFTTALDFVNAVGEISESEGHHPNISIHDYKKVTLEVYTHKIRGLHKNDFILAAKIDKKVADYL